MSARRFDRMSVRRVASAVLITSASVALLSGCFSLPGATSGSSGSDLAGCAEFQTATDAFIVSATDAGDSSDAYADATEEYSAAISAASEKATDEDLKNALITGVAATDAMTSMLRAEVDWTETTNDNWFTSLNVVTSLCGQEEITSD